MTQYIKDMGGVDESIRMFQKNDHNAVVEERFKLDVSNTSEALINDLPVDKSQLNNLLSALHNTGLLLDKKVRNLVSMYPEESKAFWRECNTIPIVHSSLKSEEKLSQNLIKALELGEGTEDIEVKGKDHKLVMNHALTRIIGSFEIIINSQYHYSTENQKFSSDLMVDLGGAEREMIDQIQELEPLSPKTASKWAIAIRDYVLLYEQVPDDRKGLFPYQHETYFQLMKKTEKRRKKLEKEMPKKIEAEYNRQMEPYKDTDPSLTETWAIHYTLKKENKLGRVSDKAKKKTLYDYIWKSLKLRLK